MSIENNKKLRINGWIYLDKPLGMSSNKLLQKVRRLFQNCKAGYVGTLDPMASGFLPVALGKATKTIKYIERSSKEYIFTVNWGVKTNTGDLEGEILANNALIPSESDINRCIKLFLGKLKQKPSKFSAIKVNGERAYKLARQGLEFDLKKRNIEIYDFKLIKYLSNSQSQFYVNSSSGTYIRTLIEDFASSMGVLGHLSSLRRIGFGKLDKKLISLDSLISLMHIDKLIRLLKPIDAIFEGVKRIDLDKCEARLILNGKSIATNNEYKKTNGKDKFAIAKYEKNLIVTGNINDGNFYPETIMNMNFNSGN